MKKCVIVHGCPSDSEKAKDPDKRTYDKHWIPWLKEKLEMKGISVQVPLMPEPWEPRYEKWKEEFNRLEINNRSILIGHSCGCAFLVRWLGETGIKINKLILVAPWKIAGEGNDIKKDFYEYQINKNIKNQADRIAIFTSDNEVIDGKKSARIFHNAMGGGIIELKGKGHYTFNDMGTDKFPEILDEILK